MLECGNRWLIGLVVLLVVLAFALGECIPGLLTKTDTVVLTQDGRYVGIKVDTEYRNPWQPSEEYFEIELPTRWDTGGVSYLPSGDFRIYHPIEIPKEEVK